MHRVVFILYPGFELLDMAGPASVFNGANRALGQVGRAPLYQILLASPTGGDTASSSGISVRTARLDELRGQRLGTLLIVGAESGPLQAAMADPELRAALPRLTAEAERFGSVCSGGMVLAGLGLLDGRRVATHWDACTPFQAHFPGVSVDPEALYVTDGRLWTSAGVTTGIDMALAMVACDLDAGISAEVAQRLVLYARRPGHQAQFSPLLLAQARADSPFAALIGWIQANLHAPLDVPTLAARAGLTERSFHRKFTAATGQTPAHFVETLRLDAARMLLSRGLPLKQVAAQVGLFPTARFSRLFEKRFGISPGTYGEMHRVEA